MSFCLEHHYSTVILDRFEQTYNATYWIRLKHQVPEVENGLDHELDFLGLGKCANEISANND